MNIAIIRFSSLGDVVLSTVILAKLKEKYPDCTIDFITSADFSVLFSTDERIRSVIPYDISRETTRSMVCFLRDLRRERYDLIIDAQFNPRSVIITSLARARRKRRVRKYSRARRRMVRNHQVWEIPHVVQRYLAAVDGAQDGDYRPLLFLDNGKSTRIHEEIKRRSRGRVVVGIAPGAGRQTKIWKVEKMKKLTHSLTERHGLFLIFLGGKSDVQLVDAISKELHGGYLNLTGKTDFRELGISLASCDAALTTDSGPMHVAGAVGTPVVSLFGPTVAEFGFRPYDERSVTVSVDLPCRPCSLHGSSRCPRGHHRCMEEIEVGVVEEAILGVLDQTQGKKEGSRQKAAGRKQ